MKLASVRFVRAVDISGLPRSSNYQLIAHADMALETCEHGVLVKSSVRTTDLLVPWAMIESADSLPDADEAQEPEVKRGPGRPKKVA